jgi:hypothetical protein
METSNLENIITEIGLEELPDKLDEILQERQKEDTYLNINVILKYSTKPNIQE